MRGKREGPRPRVPDPNYILVLDVGGTHVKFRRGAHGADQAFESGPSMTPGRMVRRLRKLLDGQRYDAVSIGYPGLVYHGRIAADPHNLGKGWVGYDFAAALGKPVKLINDAAMQALGSYEGGRMLFLGLGTGLGSALIIDHVLAPLELAHLPYKKKRSFEDYVGLRGLNRLGKKKWQLAVEDVVARLQAALVADTVV